MGSIKIAVLKLRQNVGDFYVGVMKAHDLHEVAKSDRIRLESLQFPRFIGIQRALDKSRVKRIGDYLTTPRSTFPSAIVVSVNSLYIIGWQDAADDGGVSTLEIVRDPEALEIIDGQHRAAALDRADASFEVVVSIFVDLDMAQRAEIFEKINSTQKPVNPSIAFQLFGYFEERSPQRTAHEIAQTLHLTEGSPFYQTLLLLGTKEDVSSGKVYLSQSTFCKEMIKLFSKDPEGDQNRLLRNEELERYPGYPLRDWFLGGQDERILETIWNFFDNVKRTWRDQWSEENVESVLRKTTGYSAFMEVLKSWLMSDRKDQIIKNEGVREALAAIRDRYMGEDTKFVRRNYPAGNQGKKKLRDALVKDLGLT